ncbi:hypothetical protein ABI59_18150 [Acidobacteria bacterium Mor1]|nr:hypothetical protein ABI59_18150 [Acidobacteria bacterium Mor1]
MIQTGETWRLFAGVCSRLLLGPFRGERLRLRQAIGYAVEAGNRSLPLVALLCFLVGVIVSLQSAHQLRTFGAADLVADLVAVSMSRELGPLLTAIIVAGRFGSAIAAQLGTMRVTQEIDALDVMGFDVVSYLVAPRLLALVVVMPCLAVFADIVGILGGWAVGTTALGIGSPAYLQRTAEALELQDVWAGLAKAMAFGLVIGLVGCQQGLATRGGPEQVGRATTRTVVRSILLIVVVDLFVTALFYVGG